MIQALEVWHPSYGPGVVLDTRWADSLLLVRFGTGEKRWIFARRLKVVKRGAAAPVPRPPMIASRRRILPVASDADEARRMVEAFRLGIVPHGSITKFTFGRDAEIARMRGLLDGFDAAGGAAAIVEGGYGVGKTHLLDYLTHLSRERGFAWAKVELEPQDVTPFRPRAIFREVCRTLRWRDPADGVEKGYRDLLRALAERRAGFPELAGCDVFDQAAAHLAKNPCPDETFWSYIEAERLERDDLQRLKYRGFQLLLDYSTSSDLYCLMLSAMGHFLEKLGCKGLLLLIDEGENLEDLAYCWQQERGFNFLRGLVMTAKSTAGLDAVGELRPRDDAGSDDGFGLIHSRIRPYPYLFGKASRIFLVISLTPSEWHYFRDLRALCSQKETVILAQFTREDFISVFEGLRGLYAKAFPRFSPPATTVDFLLRFMLTRSRNIRRFIKGSVEGFDILRHYPGFLKEDFFRFCESA